MTELSDKELMQSLVAGLKKSDDTLTRTIPTVRELVAHNEYIENWWEGDDDKNPNNGAYTLEGPAALDDPALLELVLHNQDGSSKKIRLRVVLA